MSAFLLRWLRRQRRHGRPTLAAAVAVFSLLPHTVFAARTDVVVLKSGDPLQGEVKELDRGRLRFSTDDMGTLYIEWNKISELTAVGLFEIETANGGRYLGQIVPAAPGTLGLAIAGRTLQLDFLTVVRLRPIKQGFLRRLSGSINLGASYAKSSGVGQASLTSDVTFRRPAFQVTANFDNTLSVKDGAVSNTRTSLRTSYTQLLRRNWLLPGFVSTDRNPELGFRLRSTVGGGVGRYLVLSNSGAFALAGGVAGGREIPVEGNGTNSVEGLIAATASFYRYDSPEAEIDASAFMYPSFTEPGRFRLELNSAFHYELFKDFTIGLTLYDSFDNRPPTESAAHNDVGVTLAFGWKFS